MKEPQGEMMKNPLGDGGAAGAHFVSRFNPDGSHAGTHECGCGAEPDALRRQYVDQLFEIDRLRKALWATRRVLRVMMGEPG